MVHVQNFNKIELNLCRNVYKHIICVPKCRMPNRECEAFQFKRLQSIELISRIINYVFEFMAEGKITFNKITMSKVFANKPQ